MYGITIAKGFLGPCLMSSEKDVAFQLPVEWHWFYVNTIFWFSFINHCIIESYDTIFLRMAIMNQRYTTISNNCTMNILN